MEIVKNNIPLNNVEIDNYLQIKNLLDFESDDDFYFLQIIRRKKENPSLGSNSKTIKTFYISNLEYYKSKIEEIKSLCRLYNARACINLNRRSYKKCAFQFLSKISNKLLNEDYVMHKTYASICGTHSNETNKKWIIDLDGEQIKEKDLIRDFLKTCEPLSENTEWNDKVIAEIPSKNGLHLITTPFNVQKFRVHFPYIDIHKDNPTNLFIP